MYHITRNYQKRDALSGTINRENNTQVEHPKKEKKTQAVERYISSLNVRLLCRIK